MSARVVDRQERRDQILTAALRVFSKKGFSKSTISDIALAAGMGKGTVYEYFATKEEIIQHSFGFFMRHLELDLETVLSARLSSMEKLTAIFDRFAMLMNDHTAELIDLMFDYWSEGIKNKTSKGVLYSEMVIFYDRYRSLFADIIGAGMTEGIFRQDIKAASAAALIVGALDGIMVQWILDKEGFDYQDVVKTIGLTFLEGITSKGISE